MDEHYFENRDCAYYPCHDAEHINCLFCFCPLYERTDCGGHFRMLKKDGGEVKDCSACLLPHQKEGYAYVLKKLGEKESSFLKF